MYIRFVIPVRDAGCRAELGFFRGAYEIFDDENLFGDWHRQELQRQVNWFDEHLEPPDIVCRRFGRHGRRSGICWFVDTAHRCIEQARYAGWLMRELGTPVEEIRTRRPGTVIWADDQQVVALAGAHVPRGFH